MTKKMAKKPAAGQNVTRISKTSRRWLVAVDPFSDLDLQPMMRFAQGTAERAGAQVVGAYVLAPELLNWSGDYSGAWLKRYRPVAETKADQLGHKLNLDIEVVPARKSGLNHSVETLLKYGGKIKAEMLLVSTHARHGIERWVLGSFAESVVLSSKIPVIAINPTQRLPNAIRRIFVPTDLSPASIKFVLKVGDFAQRVNAGVDLFYRQPDPLDPMIQQGVYAVGGGWVSMQNYIDDSSKEAEQKLHKIEAGLRKRGLDAQSLVTTARGSSSLVNSIEEAAKARQADVIAVLTQSGPVAATMLGSVARGLVRTAPVPVMIFR